jgi:hypothetical protein
LQTPDAASVEADMTNRIALLGWGSLLWEGGSEFDKWHDPWQYDGPELKIEFSRISTSRFGALTLVIDPDNGVSTRVAYSFSRRQSLPEVVKDLRTREGTTSEDIGFFDRSSKTRSRDPRSQHAVRTWATEHALDGAVWTDLPSNFSEKTGQPFTVANALAYLNTLDPRGRAAVVEYIKRAPGFIITPLRAAFEVERKGTSGLATKY